MKKSISQYVIIVLLVLIMFLASMFLSAKESRVYAQSYWSDIFDSYPSVTYVNNQAHEWENNLSNYAQDCYLYYLSSGNTSFIESYQIYANGTYFTEIQNGAVSRNNETYWNLLHNEKLVFEIYLKPNSMSENKTIVVNQGFVVYKTLLGDSNRDDIINIYDGIILGNVFGNNKEMSNWNVNCTKNDWNNDGIINIYDGIILGAHFGENQ